LPPYSPLVFTSITPVPFAFLTLHTSLSCSSVTFQEHTLEL
jgi:hypothetical protein